MINLTTSEVETMRELIEAARDCYATAQVMRALHGENPLRSNIAMQRLHRAVLAADRVEFKPAAVKVQKPAKAAK